MEASISIKKNKDTLEHTSIDRVKGIMISGQAKTVSIFTDKGPAQVFDFSKINKISIF